MSSSTCEDSALDGGPWDGTDVKSATKSAIPLAMVALATVVQVDSRSSYESSSTPACSATSSMISGLFIILSERKHICP